MSTSASVESYLRRLRQVEARIRPTPRVALPPPELRWNQPVVDRQGRTHWLELEWQPWMGCIGYVMVLLDCIEDAAHGEPRGKSYAVARYRCRLRPRPATAECARSSADVLQRYEATRYHSPS